MSALPTIIDERAALEVLDAPHCPHCNHHKRKGVALCLKCRHALAVASSPHVEPWLNLYLPIGKGFEQAFATAMQTLAAIRDAETVPLFVAGESEESKVGASPIVAQ